MRKILSLFDAALSLPRSLLLTIAGSIAGLLCLYLPIGMLLIHKVDDDMEFQAGRFSVEHASHSVAIAVALIDREVNHHHWTPNDPFFLPGAWLERMPAFQKGIVSALSRFAIQLSDQIGRTRGSSMVDDDLQKAVGLLNYSPHVWVFDFSTTILPTASSETQYRSAMAALINYNLRLSRGEAMFDRRSDNLLETLDRIAADLGGVSGSIASHLDAYSGGMFDSRADILFYDTKGRMYAYYLILRELRKDYQEVIAEKQLQAAWDLMLQNLREGAAIHHFFVFNASLDSQFLPNHLATQGFFLLRARTQLREITNILLK